MKKIFMLLACSSLMFVAATGFSYERNLAPTEETVFTDLAYDNVVVCSFAEVNSVDFINLEVDLNTYCGETYERNVGLASTFYFLIDNRREYPHLNEWKTNKKYLTHRDKHLSISHGGVVLKISLV